MQPETLAEQAAWSAVNEGAWDAETPLLLHKSLSSTSTLALSAPPVHDVSMNKDVPCSSKSPTYSSLVRSSVKRARDEEDENAVKLRAPARSIVRK